MFGDNGSITHFVKVGDDMTREKALTDALKEKEERLNMALEASRDGLWDWNMQTGEIYFSPRYSTMLGYDPDELPRSYDTWVGLLHPDDREKAEKMIRDHIKKESGPFEQEFRMKTKSGKWKWILGKGKVFSVDANGRPIRVVGTHTDITEKKKTERELKIRNQIARIFLTTPGDEIYDKILALVLDMTQSRYGIFGFVSEANEWVCPSLTREIWEQCQVPDKQITFPHAAWTGIWGQAMAEKKCRYVNRTLHLPEGHIAIENALDAPLVYKGGERAKELVMQILAFSRQQEQDAAPTQIGPIVKEAIKFLKATLPSYIEIHQRIIPDPGMILADPTRIHQVLMNLCTNAAQAMDRAGGTLTVTLDRVTLDAADVAVHPDLAPGKYLKLMVQDTGHGITTDILPKIFDPYFTTKRRGKGTGMGLATAHGIITSCGGAITVYSEPGQGTTFHVYFPVAEKPAGTRTAPPGSAPAPTGSGDGTGADVFAKGDAAILFVDDEPAIAKLGKHLLENLGYRVESRTDPLAALALVKDNPGRFDLVITDMTMPGMSGDRLARELITLRPDLPVILCSGFSVELSEHEAATAGIKAFIMKPLLKDKLAQTIKTVLSSRSLTKKNTNLQEKQDKEFP
ncbi:MAG: PAS domain-containing protein, partial [Desulfotignum sp.]|nr:PAS domain-containing protein [Desulfotignum sp.]